MALSGRAVVNHAGYKAYMRSPQWQEVRKRYWRSGLPKECFCCHAKGVPLDLHHKTYKNLGCERLMDLTLLCRPCHDEVHRLPLGGKVTLWNSVKVVRRRRRKHAR